ncbi:hypothetical protein AMECASPLE_038657 [Ameca splendens]|uniref:Uncharacterized protein n=1 Tax=Ameca splendens TaxID=208324 RepID=A0ABV0ZUD6_9TELE
MQDPPSLTLTPQTTGPLVECVYCAEIFSFSEIQGHNDCCEKEHWQSSSVQWDRRSQGPIHFQRKDLIDGDLFRVAGRTIGHSFLHGGPRLTGLSPAMLQLIVGSNQEFAALELADCPDTDVLDVVCVLDSQRELTPHERCEVNNLAFGWDLPPINDNNRRWLAEKILQHAVL